MTQCRYCNSSSFGSGCPHSPTKKHEHNGDEKKCEFCNSSSYGSAARTARPRNTDMAVALTVASRMIVRTFDKQMRMRSVPVFHGPHRGFALECRLG